MAPLAPYTATHYHTTCHPSLLHPRPPTSHVGASRQSLGLTSQERCETKQSRCGEVGASTLRRLNLRRQSLGTSRPPAAAGSSRCASSIESSMQPPHKQHMRLERHHESQCESLRLYATPQPSLRTLPRVHASSIPYASRLCYLYTICLRTDCLRTHFVSQCPPQLQLQAPQRSCALEAASAIPL